MGKNLDKLINGYQEFKTKYATNDHNLMQELAENGQHPKVMIVGCADSRVDPAILLQCDPGDLFIVRNVANIVPSINDGAINYAVSSALNFGICHLKVEQLIILGHSQCGGMQALLKSKEQPLDGVIGNWVSVVKNAALDTNDLETCTKNALHESLQNCLSYPWLKERVDAGELTINLWYFDIKSGSVLVYKDSTKEFEVRL